jgi:hypothetical protein
LAVAVRHSDSELRSLARDYDAHLCLES